MTTLSSLSPLLYTRMTDFILPPRDSTAFSLGRGASGTPFRIQHRNTPVVRPMSSSRAVIQGFLDSQNIASAFGARGGVPTSFTQDEDDETEMEWKTRLTAWIRQMMFVSGETGDPTTETTGIIEEIVRQQVVEIVSVTSGADDGYFRDAKPG